MVIYLPIMAFGQAATTFSSQNTGTGDFSRIKRGTVIAAGLGVAVTLGISGGILLFSETVIGWFMKDPETLSAAIMIAFVSYPFYWLYHIMEVLGGSLRGMGYAAHSMAIVLFNLCGVRIILLALFTRYFHTLRSVASVYPITWALAATFFRFYFGMSFGKIILSQMWRELCSQVLGYPFEERVCIVCNEEGKLEGLPLNRALREDGPNGEILDILAGTCFLCDCSGVSFDSLSREQSERYQEKFRYPERFYRAGDTICAVPVKDKDRER